MKEVNGPHLTHRVTKWLTEWIDEMPCDGCAGTTMIGEPLARTSAGLYLCQECGDRLGGPS